MSDFSFVAIPPQGVQSFDEKLIVGAHGVKGQIKCYSGLSGDYWVSYIPSLNVSGYGESEAESMEDVRANLDIMFEDLFSVSEVERMLEFKKLGWERNKFFKKRLSQTFVDENGVLQNFTYPDQVKKMVLQAA